jgi:hypothetical protein
LVGTASVLVSQASRPNVQVDAALKEKGAWTQSGGSLPLTLTKIR